MKLDEAIAHAKEVAENWKSQLVNCVSEEGSYKCLECAKEHEQLAEWLTELKERREADRWISVKDKLPEKNDFVLVYDGSDMFVAWYENEGMSEGWHSYDVTYDGFPPIIAWRPLPKPYTESEV